MRFCDKTAHHKAVTDRRGSCGHDQPKDTEASRKQTIISVENISLWAYDTWLRRLNSPSIQQFHSRGCWTLWVYLGMKTIKVCTAESMCQVLTYKHLWDTFGTVINHHRCRLKVLIISNQQTPHSYTNTHKQTHSQTHTNTQHFLKW